MGWSSGGIVIPGRCKASNPESRDSGSGPSDHPGMTAARLLRRGASRNDENEPSLALQRVGRIGAEGVIRRYVWQDGGLWLPPSLFELRRTSRLQPALRTHETQSGLRVWQLSKHVLARGRTMAVLQMAGSWNDT